MTLFGERKGEQMDDLINRQAAINELNVGAELLRRVLDDTDIVGGEREKYEWGLGLIESCISDMKDLPPVRPERKKGKWIDGKCSECGEPKPISKVFDRGELVWDRETHINYCNNCGAEMEKGDE